VTEKLSLWFLLCGLFLPRLTMLVAYASHSFPFDPMPSVLEFFGWLLVPRVLIAYFIYERSGASAWFWVYIVATLLVWIGSASKRSSHDDDEPE
jgi:hypothetical protein